MIRYTLQSLVTGMVLFFAIAVASGAGIYISSFFEPIPPVYVKWVVSAPFYAGFIWLGFDGLIMVVRERGSVKCLEGFAVALVSYVAIEVLFWFCGGSIFT